PVKVVKVQQVEKRSNLDAEVASLRRDLNRILDCLQEEVVVASVKNHDKKHHSRRRSRGDSMNDNPQEEESVEVMEDTPATPETQTPQPVFKDSAQHAQFEAFVRQQSQTPPPTVQPPAAATPVATPQLPVRPVPTPTTPQVPNPEKTRCELCGGYYHGDRHTCWQRHQRAKCWRC